MQVVFIEVTYAKKPLLINAINIKEMIPAKKGKGCLIVYDDGEFREVEESLEQIATALVGLDMLRKPANLS